MSGSITESKQHNLPDICDLFNKYGSDKDRNGYLQIYHSLFAKSRIEPITILTIGSSNSSLSALREYFISGHVISIGNESTENHNDSGLIEYYVCDSTNKDEVSNFMVKIGNKFDIIIDDGSGSDLNQISTLRNFYTHLKDDGFYIVEELSPENKLVQCPSLVGCLCGHDSYFFAGIKKSMCIIQKHHLNTKRKTY
jgi:hypothetical protein